jgi:ectoine hydroxylase-related dioxygenase (phytanoyl-CoA dioxygenase family)
VPHVSSREGMAFGEEADETYYDTSDLINMELAPGEFFLFNEKIMHHSEPNRSDRRRLGLSVRVTIPIVKIDHDKFPLHPGHHAILICGEDYMNFNRLMAPPSEG